MRWRRYALLIVMLAGSLAPTFTSLSPACDCRHVPLNPDSLLDTAGFVFTGKVLSLLERTEHLSITRDGSAETTVRPILGNAPGSFLLSPSGSAKGWARIAAWYGSSRRPRIWPGC
jgi:hypothetical protein